MTSYKVAFIKTNAFQKKVVGKNYYEGYDNEVEGSAPIIPFYFTEDYSRSWDSGNPFSYSSLRNGEIESIDYDSSKLTVKFLNYDTFSYEEKVYEVGVPATDEKIVDPSDHSKLFEFTPTEILVADSLNSSEPILETLRDSLMEFEQNKGKIPKMAETYEAELDEIQDGIAIVRNRLGDAVGNIDLNDHNVEDVFIEIYNDKGVLLEEIVLGAETFGAEGDSWDGTTGDDFRKYDDMELTEDDHEILVEEIERGFENYPADTLRNAKASAVSQINWFGIDKSHGDYDAETFEARTKRKSIYDPFNEDNELREDVAGSKMVSVPDGKHLGRRRYDRHERKRKGHKRQNNPKKTDYDNQTLGQDFFKKRQQGKEDMQKIDFDAEYVACAECGDYVFELESNTCCEECNDNLNEAFEWIAKENGEENLRDFMDSIDITDDDLNAETFGAEFEAEIKPYMKELPFPDNINPTKELGFLDKNGNPIALYIGSDGHNHYEDYGDVEWWVVSNWWDDKPLRPNQESEVKRFLNEYLKYHGVPEYKITWSNNSEGSSDVYITLNPLPADEEKLWKSYWDNKKEKSCSHENLSIKTMEVLNGELLLTLDCDNCGKRTSTSASLNQGWDAETFGAENVKIDWDAVAKEEWELGYPHDDDLLSYQNKQANKSLLSCLNSYLKVAKDVVTMGRYDYPDLAEYTITPEYEKAYGRRPTSAEINEALPKVIKGLRKQAKTGKLAGVDDWEELSKALKSPLSQYTWGQGYEGSYGNKGRKGWFTNDDNYEPLNAETFEANAKSGDKVYVITRRCEDYSAYRELDVAIFGSKTEAKKKFNILFKEAKEEEYPDETIADAKSYMRWGDVGWGIESFMAGDMIYELNEHTVGNKGDFYFDAEGHGNWTLNYNDYPNCCPFHQKYTDVMSNSMPCGDVLWGQGFSVDIEGKQYNIWGHEVND